MGYIKYLICWLLPTLVLFGCARQDNAVAVVNKHLITVFDVEDRISKLPLKFRSVAKENKPAFIDEMVTDLLLYDEAVRNGLLSDNEIKRVIEEAQKKIVVARFIKDKVEDKIKISETEIEDYYKTHQNDFISQTKYRASHILVPDEDEAKKILDKLKTQNFEELAKAYSIDSTAKRGGDVGYFSKGELIPEFENVCFNLNIGETSPVIKTQFGYHIIKLTDRIAPEPKKIDEVKDDIVNILKAKKRQELFNSLIASLRAKSKVKINEDLIKSIDVHDVTSN